MKFHITQNTLDMLNLLKQETQVILGTGDTSPHSDTIRRIDNVLTVLADVTGTVLALKTHTNLPVPVAPVVVPEAAKVDPDYAAYLAAKAAAAKSVTVAPVDPEYQAWLDSKKVAVTEQPQLVLSMDAPMPQPVFVPEPSPVEPVASPFNFG